MRPRARADAGREVLPARTGSVPEPRFQRSAQQGFGHPLQQPVSDPVGLDDPVVERVRQTVRGGDQLEVGPGALETAREDSEAAVGECLPLGRRTELEQRAVLVGPAVAEDVRRIREPREADRPGDHAGTRGRDDRRGRSATPVTRATPPAISTRPAGSAVTGWAAISSSR